MAGHGPCGVTYCTYEIMHSVCKYCISGMNVIFVVNKGKIFNLRNLTFSVFVQYFVTIPPAVELLIRHKHYYCCIKCKKYMVYISL